MTHLFSLSDSARRLEAASGADESNRSLDDLEPAYDAMDLHVPEAVVTLIERAGKRLAACRSLRPQAHRTMVSA